MGNAFGDSKTLKERMRENKRGLDRSIRSLDRERAGLERQEKQLIAEIKKNARDNQMKSVKIMAKDLVRIRKHQEKFINLTAQLRAIGLQMTSMASTQAISESMKKATSSMVALNKSLKLPELQKIMQEFAKQSEIMEMKQEVMGDAIEDALDDVEDEEETDKITNQVLDEIGINMADNLVDAPAKKAQQEQVVQSDADKELEARLNNLKR